MIATALLLSLLAATGTPVLVAVSAEGFAEKDRAAVVARVVGDAEEAGATPMPLPPGVVTPACADDPACARTLFAGGIAVRLLVVDVLRAGSRASIAARVIDPTGATIAHHAGVVPITKLLAGREPLLADDVLASLSVPPPPAPTVTPPTAVPTPTPPTTAAPTTAPPTTTAASTPPADPAPVLDPTTMAIAGVSVAAVGALFLVGGSAAALGQNAVRLDASADGAARQNTAVTIPLALAVATVGAVGVAAGVVMLLGEGEGDDASVPGAGG